MKRVIGIGGIFFKAKDPKALGAWYRDHLGLPLQSWGGAVFRPQPGDAAPGATVWTPFAQDSTYFGPGGSPFMVSFRVHDLHALLAALRAEGCAVDAQVDESEHGKFGWVTDPEGNRVELWEPPAEG